MCVVTVQPGMAAPTRRLGVDYAQAANWVCRPNAEKLCATGLDTLVAAADGQRHRQNFTPAANPPIDCFYVYPTVSEEPSTYSDLRLTRPVIAATHSQVGRLSARCRLFAPIYRQLTLHGLSTRLAAHATLNWQTPYDDVRAAWRYYLAHDNDGRGVVLIGHSQGSILLHLLLAREIDGHAAQTKLLAAFLGGDLAFPVARDGASGGSLRHIPLCQAAGQIGCVYVWNSYLADDRSTSRMFGRAPPAPLLAGCASPAGSGGELEAYFHRPDSAPADDPSWITYVGALSGQCVSDAQGVRLAVAVRPDPAPIARAVMTALRAGVRGAPPGWGLHNLDINLLQGNILDRIGDETSTWLRAHPQTR